MLEELIKDINALGIKINEIVKRNNSGVHYDTDIDQLCDYLQQIDMTLRAYMQTIMEMSDMKED